MDQHKDLAPAAADAAPATWPRPTLTAMAPLRDLTLQSGNIAAAAGEVSGLSFLP